MVYYQTNLGKLYNSDCIEVMKDISSNSIDLILTDPPYNTRKKSTIELHGYVVSSNFVEEVYEGWDNVSLKDLYSNIFPIFNRILKDNGSVVMFTGQDGIGYAKEFAEDNDLELKSLMIWEKTNATPSIRQKNYVSAIEPIIWLSRRREICDYRFNFLGHHEMLNIFRYPICGGKERTNHATQKPLRLIEKLIYIHSNEGDTILDPFLGSGTVSVACEKMNRKWIGIEVIASYCNISKDKDK